MLDKSTFLAKRHAKGDFPNHGTHHRNLQNHGRGRREGQSLRAPPTSATRSSAFVLDGELYGLHREATEATERLNLATSMVPSPDWFLYGFVRKEAVISSQIEGTQATLKDVVSFEATRQAEHPAEVEEVCNYIDALARIRSAGQSSNLKL